MDLNRRKTVEQPLTISLHNTDSSARRSRDEAGLQHNMPHTIRFLEHPPLYPSGSEYWAGSVDFSRMEIGDICYYHHEGKPCKDSAQLKKLHLTKHYFKHNSDRPPLILALSDKPSGKIYFMVDGQCYSGECTRCGKDVHGKCKCPEPKIPKGYYDGWAVSGTPPHITVSPSVNYDDDERGIKHYHGFIKNGVIGDG